MNCISDLFKLEIQKALPRKSGSYRNMWPHVARPSQLPPDGDWRIWCIIAGRGFGKTRTGAETIKMWVAEGKCKRIALLGSTIEDVKKVMIEGESGLLNIHHKNELKYFPGKNLLQWSNGAIATIYSGESYEGLRGPQFDAAWVDELAKFNKSQETWDQLMLCMRLGKHPRVIVTTTPRPVPLIKKLLARKDVVVTHGSTMENAANLSESYLEEIQHSYGGTRFGAQEIDGQLIESLSLWKESMIKIYDQELPLMKCIVIGIDPAMTAAGNETGIVVVGVDFLGRFFVLNDASGNYTPNQWMQKVQEQFVEYQAQLVIVEINQGGEVVTSMLQSLPVYPVRASKSKGARAMPIAALYEQELVYHAKAMPELCKQLLDFESAKSVDRVDALVWAIEVLRSSIR